MSKKNIVNKINNKRDELALDVEIAAEQWINYGNSQKLLSLSQEMDKLILEYYRSPHKVNPVIAEGLEIDEEAVKDNVYLWIKTVKIDNKKIYQCWVKEFGEITKIGDYYKKTSKWSGSGAQECGMAYIVKKYPNLKNIKFVDMDTIKDKYSTSWKKIKKPND